MTKKNHKILFLILLFVIFALPLVGFAQSNITGMLENTAGQQGAGYNTSIDQETGLATIAGTIIRGALSLLGVVFVCLVIYAGFLWMTASGNEEQISKAKKIMIGAIIGLIITLSAFAIYSFVMSALMGGSNT